MTSSPSPPCFTPATVPSRDCLHRLLLLKPEAFQLCFQDWIASLAKQQQSDDGRPMAVDGKTRRGSHDRGRELKPLHIVSAWASEEGVALGQVATEEKSNEITVIPELLEHLQLDGAVVTIDAMGCQRAIVEQIVAQKGDFVIAVKDDQPKLRAAIEGFFNEQIDRDFQDLDHRRHDACDEGRARIDERAY